MQEQEVVTSVGTFILKKPSAGQRNKALIKAETAEGFKASLFLIDLLPKCIAKRPADVDQTIPITDILDSLEMDDYDKLSLCLNKMLQDTSAAMTEEKLNEKKS